MTKQYGKAIKFLKEGEKQDDTELLVKLNLAHAYLMNDELETQNPFIRHIVLKISTIA
jgi:hypothetical protein